MKPSTALKKAKALLERPEIAYALREAFEKAVDFTAVDAMQKHVDWIQGNVEHEGKKLPPSFEALKAYEAFAFPKAAKQVNVNQQTLVARVNLRDEAPEIKVRTIEALPEGDA